MIEASRGSKKGSGSSRVNVNKRNTSVYRCGESKTEAIEKNLKFYIGPPCKNEHKFNSDGKVIDGAVRNLHGACLECAYQISRKQKHKRYKEKDDCKQSPEARKRIEDIKLAKELGISADEL